VRWQHPELGRPGRSAFLSIAEGSGLIVVIGTWVLNEARLTAQRIGDVRPAVA
jgi:ammonium transporter, Amt family